MQGEIRTINSKKTLEAAIEHLQQTFEKKGWFQYQINTKKQRSILQNSALHLWCGQVAHALNKAGHDVRQVLAQSKRAEIQWTGAAVKEHLWRPVQVAYKGEHSTARCSTDDYPAIYESLNKALSQAFGVHVPWPNKDHGKVSK